MGGIPLGSPVFSTPIVPVRDTFLRAHLAFVQPQITGETIFGHGDDFLEIHLIPHMLEELFTIGVWATNFQLVGCPIWHCSLHFHCRLRPVHGRWSLFAPVFVILLVLL